MLRSGICILFSLVSSLVYAGTTTVNIAQVPQTGESAVMGNPQFSMPSGADGNPPAGKAWPNPRFVIGTGIESNCITDRLTGLIWAKNAQLFSSSTWSNGLSTISSMNTNSVATGYNLCGHSDWRMPNKRELVSLVNYGYTGSSVPASTQKYWLEGRGFSNVQSTPYWSSSSNAQNTTEAWRLVISDGSTNTTAKSTTNNIWPVRGGQ